jgi:hypothetical protein
MIAKITFNIAVSEYNPELEHSSAHNKAFLISETDDKSDPEKIELITYSELMEYESDYEEYIEFIFPSADNIHIEITDDIVEGINDKEDNGEQRIIVEYYEGGFYEQEGGDHKLHVFNRIDQIKPVLWSACRPYLENCNNLKVYVQKDTKSGAEEDYDVLREQIYDIITGSSGS